MTRKTERLKIVDCFAFMECFMNIQIVKVCSLNGNLSRNSVKTYYFFVRFFFKCRIIEPTVAGRSTKVRNLTTKKFPSTAINFCMEPIDWITVIIAT